MRSLNFVLEEGLAIFLTGLSGAGKSTLAKGLMNAISPITPVTLLDGDIIRDVISSELGFSKEHRDLNIRRIGYIASEIVRHSGVVICAAIAPYKEVRDEVRKLFPKEKFILIHVSTPLTTCEKRDPKGLYAKARAGKITNFTGVSDPYEPPKNAELKIDTSGRVVSTCVEEILEYIKNGSYFK
jgi:sulfate adenylyltransferase